MIFEFDSCPFQIGALASVSAERARERALKHIKENLGHVYVDVPIASDAAGSQEYARFMLRTFLHPDSKDTREMLGRCMQFMFQEILDAGGMVEGFGMELPIDEFLTQEAANEGK